MEDNTFTVRGASVIDGSGKAGTREDVLVVEGRVAEVGRIIKGNERGKIVDATDLTLSPGFIDMHAHSDLAVISDHEHLAKVTQGVTLEVVGQDGLAMCHQMRAPLRCFAINSLAGTLILLELIGNLDRSQII